MIIGASINDFQYCYPLISINSTHLYGKHKVKMLVAVAYDTNNRIYPLCFFFLLWNKRQTNLVVFPEMFM
jgi:hypothetical protein